METEQSHVNQDIRFSPAPPDPTRILVADDSRNAADILGVFLRIEGYEVAVAYDGREAIELAATFAPKLVFLDLGMPGLDGLETARELRRRYPEIFLAALSGMGTEEDRRKTDEAGFDLHLVKPAKPDDLKRALRLLETESARE
ncbi:response regulator [Luteolibacter yonseiensis]|uniref:Response regulator n=1 Tax=Luteolibacter yonseiensis TaxID=1144680 RepID=A0A934VDN2_9BACT|nr:response regulator [Luteolibacter yonseiensis]MBK1818211.1 response regulator [Luteolibacter yonseiensis]